jgi:ComF family protein
MLSSFFQDIRLGLESIAFPKVCASCAHLLTDEEAAVCEICINERLESCMNFEQDILLPPKVMAVCSLWEFDKGGMLQDLLHKLKYQHQRGIAFDLGKKLGRKLKASFFSMGEENYRDWAVLAVPLHPSKQRKRGYNQAYEISRGLRKSLPLTLMDADCMLRKKRTRSQTAFSLLKRSDNLKDAFELNPEKKLTHKNIIIVDDVFTTGATTFELCRILRNEDIEKLIIATLARA